MLPHNSNPAIDELLVSFLLGEATPEQQAAALDWIESSEDNARYFQEFSLLWEQSRELAAQSTVDVDAAWARMKEKILQQNPVEIPQAKIVRLGGWRRVAAILALVLTAALGWILWRQLSATQWQELAAATPGQETFLPDSSKITLNKGAAISYPRAYTGRTRRVKLKGEAFFEVKRNPQQPFEVEVNALTVTVLGTSFNIRETDSSTQVIVETGHVRVSDGSQSVDLVAGEEINVPRKKSSWTKAPQTDKLYQYYRTRSFTCDQTPLWKLVEVLNEAYDAQIVISNPAIRNLPITTVFENQPLDQVLSIIQQTLNITITRKGDKIYVE